MRNKHFGSSYRDWVKEQERKDPGFRAGVDELKAKAIMGMMLKNARTKKRMTQAALSKKSGVPASVISRIESPEFDVMPRLNLFTKLASALGYRVVLSLEKDKTR